MNKSKQKGTAWETAIVNTLDVYDLPARRNPPVGAKDVGDILVVDVPWIVIEAKNAKAMRLAEWVDEADVEAFNAGEALGVVWHHRPRTSKPVEGYVTMSGRAFVELLQILRDTGA